MPLGEAIEIRVKEGRGYYAGLESCGNSWLCTVCGPKIRYRHAGILRAGLISWQARGFFNTAITTTIPHDGPDPLIDLQAVIRDGWHRFRRNRPGRRLAARLRIRGFVTAEEVTHRTGWHPHLHNLGWHEEPLTAEDIAELHAAVLAAFTAACRKAGLRDPHPVHGVHIDPNVSVAKLGDYLTKVQESKGWDVADELARGDLKTARSRTPFDIHADYYATGDADDRRLWREYRAAMKGKSAIRWSRGLRVIVFGENAEPEKTDEELAAEEVDGDAVAVLPIPVWRRVRMARLDLAVIVAAERGGLDAVNELLAAHGCGWAHDPPSRDEGG